MANQNSLQFASVLSFPGQPAPSNPPVGTVLLYADNTTGLLTAIDSNGNVVLAAAAADFPAQAANTVLAGPSSGGNAKPTFRATVAADIPSTLTSGTAITNAALTTPVLGTPSSGTLTNTTGYLWNNLAAATGAMLIANGLNNSEIDNLAPVTSPTFTIANTAPTLQSGTVLSQVTIATPDGTHTTYTGTITGGGSNAYAGASVTFAGFTNGTNNGTFVITASTTTTLVVLTVSQVNETHAGTAVSSAVVSSPKLIINTTSPSAGSSVVDGFTLQVVPSALTTNPTATLQIRHSTAGGGGSQLAFGSTNQFIIGGNGNVTTYKSMALGSSLGIAVIAKNTTLLTAQAAAISGSLAFATGSSFGAGLYRINYVATITTVDGTSCVLGGATGFQIVFTNANGDVIVKTSNPTTVNVSAVNATGTTVSGSVMGYAGASTNINYNFGYTGVGGQMRYDLAYNVEYLG